jgi:hypothetical protein
MIALKEDSDAIKTMPDLPAEHTDESKTPLPVNKDKTRNNETDTHPSTDLWGFHERLVYYSTKG